MLRISAPIVPESGAMSSWTDVVVVMGFLSAGGRLGRCGCIILTKPLRIVKFPRGHRVSHRVRRVSSCEQLFDPVVDSEQVFVFQ